MELNGKTYQLVENDNKTCQGCAFNPTPEQEICACDFYNTGHPDENKCLDIDELYKVWKEVKVMNYNGKNYELVKQTEEESKNTGLSHGCVGCAFFEDILNCHRQPGGDQCIDESGNDFEMIWKEVNP